MIRDWDSYVLPVREQRIVRALAQVLLVETAASSGAPPRDAALEDAVRDARVWLGTPNPMLRTALRALLVGLELSPVTVGLGVRTLSGLSLGQRLRCVEALDRAGSPALEAWKSILGMAFFGRPSGALRMDLVSLAAPPARLRRPQAPTAHRLQVLVVAGTA